jgi:hypothetical protein
MPKYKSVVISKEIKNPDGSIQKVGTTAWVPVNEAAKATEHARTAAELGAYKPATPTEIDDTKKVLKEKERVAASKIRI